MARGRPAKCKPGPVITDFMNTHTRVWRGTTGARRTCGRAGCAQRSGALATEVKQVAEGILKVSMQLFKEEQRLEPLNLYASATLVGAGGTAARNRATGCVQCVQSPGQRQSLPLSPGQFGATDDLAVQLRRPAVWKARVSHRPATRSPDRPMMVQSPILSPGQRDGRTTWRHSRNIAGGT